MPRLRIAQVALPVPLHRLFDYQLADDTPKIAPGCRVRVPFGNRSLVGIVVALSDSTDLSPAQIRHVEQCLDTEPLLDTELMQLNRWTADYYHHPLGETLLHTLPTLLRQGAAAQERPTPQSLGVQLTHEGRGLPTGALARARRQAELISALQTIAALSLEECKARGFSREVIRQLQLKGLIEICELEQTAPPCEPSLTLLPQQRQALDAIKPEGFQACLLEGATGSGKTEVYLQAIARIQAHQPHSQALVLVPEIALTPQMLSRFRQRFGDTVAGLHSGLNDSERLDVWVRARSGKARIIIGTRSAIFTPLAHPGIIIVDEEHDLSFKQQDGLRYNARDLALVRARQAKIPVILGSATPALETLHNTNQGRYHHLRLSQRTGTQHRAPIHMVDLASEAQHQGMAQSSQAAIERHLQAGNQVMVFLNRRGFAPTLQCADCGWIADCPHCDARLTLHRQPVHLRCHHCDHRRTPPARCTVCHSSRLQPLGQGTARMEESLAQAFPTTPIIRIDRDSTRGQHSLTKLLKPVHQGQPCILIGTQMLAKGHHFPHLTLVVVMDADAGLFSADFRSAERMGQLLTQVAGRAGRADKPGEVLLQSRYPEHPYLQTLIQQGYGVFAQLLLSERELGQMPPYSYLALLRADAPDPLLAESFLQRAKKLAHTLNTEGIELLGPLPALMERRGQRYRFLLQCKSLSRPQLRQFLHTFIEALRRETPPRNLRWAIDVDPQDMG